MSTAAYSVGPGTLKISVLQGKALAPKDADGKADPYCLFGFWDEHDKPIPNLTHKTKYKKAVLNPTWYADKDLSEKTFVLKSKIQHNFRLEVWDYDTVGDPDYMGEVNIPLERIIKTPVWRYTDPLTKRQGYKGKVSGTLIFVWEYKADPSVAKEEEKIRAALLAAEQRTDIEEQVEKAAKKTKDHRSKEKKPDGTKGVSIAETPKPESKVEKPDDPNVVSGKSPIDKKRHSALLGDAEAAFELGALYAKGSEEQGIEQNDKEALKYYMIAAEAGHATAQFKCGLFFQMGYGTGNGTGSGNAGETGGTPNLPRAFIWYEKAVAQNQPDAMTALGEMYESGWVGDGPDMAKAIELYEKAESLGEMDCLSALGRVYKQKGKSDPENYKKALHYFEKSVSSNPEDTESLFNIAEIYENGWGVDADVQKAISYYQKAAQFDDMDDAVEALQRLTAK